MYILHPTVADALVKAASDLQGAPASGRKLQEAKNAVSDVLLTLHGAPFMFQGLFKPDADPYPLPTTDPIVITARENVGLGEGVEAGFVAGYAPVKAAQAALDVNHAALRLEDGNPPSTALFHLLSSLVEWCDAQTPRVDFNAVLGEVRAHFAENRYEV